MLPSCFQVHPSEPLTDLHWSHLESLLRENQPPSDIEKQTLAKVEHDIEEYDLAIARLQPAVASLKSQRDLAEDYVSRQKSLLAPIRRLSSDLLVEIFTYLCSNTVLGASRTFTHLPQLHLCQVCKYWRSLVNDSPLLWSALEFTANDDPDCSEDRISDPTLLYLAHLVLTRSGNCPLTIGLFNLHDVHPVSALLLQHANRWLSAFVRGCSPRFFSVSSFPQLKHLDFRFESSDTQTTPAMPSLESLIINQLSSHRPLSLSDFPWKQLKRLMLYASLVSQCASIVSWCVQLEHITVVFAEQLAEDLLPPVSIVSQTITSATLKWAEEGSEKLFSLLQFPQLHTLNLYDCHFSADSLTAHLPSITNLNLQNLDFDHDTLVLLRLLSTVTHLSFQVSRFHCMQPSCTLDFLSKLHPTDPQSRTLLPRLTHFDMLIGGTETWPGLAAAFIEMVKSRVMEGQLETRLESVRFTAPDDCLLNHELISSWASRLKDDMAISIEDRCGLIL